MATTLRRFSAITRRLMPQRQEAHKDTAMYTGAQKWMVPLGLGLVTIANIIMVLGGLILTGNAEMLDDDFDYNFRAYVGVCTCCGRHD